MTLIYLSVFYVFGFGALGALGTAREYVAAAMCCGISGSDKLLYYFMTFDESKEVLMMV